MSIVAYILPVQVVQLEKEVEYIKVGMLLCHFSFLDAAFPLLTFAKVSCFKDSSLAQLKRELMLLRRSTMQRRVVQRWLEAVQRRRREKEKEEEMVRFDIVNQYFKLSFHFCVLGKERKRQLLEKDEMVAALRERMKSR